MKKKRNVFIREKKRILQKFLCLVSVIMTFFYIAHIHIDINLYTPSIFFISPTYLDRQAHAQAPMLGRTRQRYNCKQKREREEKKRKKIAGSV